MCRPGAFRFVLVVLGLFFASSGALAANCDPSARPGADTSNVWYCSNDSDTVVVFVHGLHSSSLTAWQDLPEDASAKDSFWPSLVVSDPSLNHPSVYLAGFYTGLGADYSTADAANELFTHLSTPVGTEQPVLAKRNILFVAHSLGGVITREVLTEHPDAFASKRVGLLLVASPSNGSAYANMLATAASVTRERLVEELAPASPFLRQLDESFKQLLQQRRIPSLIGRELVENQFVDLGGKQKSMFAQMESQFGWLIAKVYGTRIVEEDSAARYFPFHVVIPKSDHFTIAQPNGLNHPSHLQLVQVFQAMVASAAPVCEPPPRFRMVLDVASTAHEPPLPENISGELKETLPLYRLWRVDASGQFIPGVSDDVKRDPEIGRHLLAPNPPFPCPGEAFRARYRRIPVTSFQATTPLQFGELCFKRSRLHSAEASAFLRCEEGKSCAVDAEAPGLAETCATTGWKWPSLITSALAEGPAPALTTQMHWEAPSLSTLLSLPANSRPSYAEFTLTSDPIAGVADATHMTYGVWVNGIEIDFDGLPPHSEPLPFNGADGVRLTFGLENLGFTGGTTGEEQIALEVSYWRGKTKLKTSRLARTYVSYRHAPPVEIVDQSDRYVWQGYFRPAAIENRYEVIVAAGSKLTAIATSKQELDNKQKRLGELPVVGVIRPGRVDNPTIGMSLGLKLEGGRIKSSFNEADAKAVCRWALTEPGLPTWMRKQAYLYEFPAETITDTKDRGRFKAACSKVR